MAAAPGRRANPLGIPVSACSIFILILPVNTPHTNLRINVRNKHRQKLGPGDHHLQLLQDRRAVSDGESLVKKTLHVSQCEEGDDRDELVQRLWV